MKLITELNRFMKKYKFQDFKIVEGNLIFTHGEEGYGVEEFSHKTLMQKEWSDLQAKTIFTADQYRSRQ